MNPIRRTYPGQAHDGRQFENLYESLDPDNVLEFAALDKRLRRRSQSGNRAALEAALKKRGVELKTPQTAPPAE